MQKWLTNKSGLHYCGLKLVEILQESFYPVRMHRSGIRNWQVDCVLLLSNSNQTWRLYEWRLLRQWFISYRVNWWQRRQCWEQNLVALQLFPRRFLHPTIFLVPLDYSQPLQAPVAHKNSCEFCISHFYCVHTHKELPHASDPIQKPTGLY